MIVCNTRNLHSTLTGVQRYTSEILSRLPGEVVKISPYNSLAGMSGHAWEQFVLPFRVDGNLLWSPSNVGPLCVKRQVVSIMDMSPLDHPEWTDKKFSNWYQFLIPKLIERVKGVLTISEFSKARILHYCPDVEHKLCVTLLAADARFKPMNDATISLAIKQLSIPTKKYIVALGSLEPRKNIKNLLEAWVRVHPLLPEDVWLVLAGAKGKRLVFGDQSYTSLPPRVFLTGHVPDDLLPALYSGAMASVYLSLYEGFGLPPLEAMSCGTPVLSSNRTSLPEVVGDAAISVDPLDVHEIGLSIIRIINNQELRKQMRYSGLRRAKLFSWDKTAKETWQFLEKAARE